MTIQWPNGQMHRMTILYRTDAPRPKARCSMLQQGVRLRDAGRGMSWLTYWRPYDLAMLSNVLGVVQCRPFKRCPYDSPYVSIRFSPGKVRIKILIFFFSMWPPVGRHSISYDFLGSTIPGLTFAVCTPAGRGQNDQRAQPQHPWYVLS